MFRFYRDNSVIVQKPKQLSLLVKNNNIKTWYIVLGIFVNIFKYVKIYIIYLQ